MASKTSHHLLLDICSPLSHEKRALQTSGGGKPSFLLSAEIELWTALVDIAKGRERTHLRMRRALVFILSLLNAPGAQPFPGWFSGKSFC